MPFLYEKMLILNVYMKNDDYCLYKSIALIKNKSNKSNKFN